jgi:hypothetical protein
MIREKSAAKNGAFLTDGKLRFPSGLAPLVLCMRKA